MNKDSCANTDRHHRTVYAHDPARSVMIINPRTDLITWPT